MARRGKKPAEERTVHEPQPEDAHPRGAKDPRLGRTHDRILEAYGEICAGTPADRALRGVFKRNRDLGSSERAEVNEVVYGVVRSQRTIDDQLERALGAEGKKKTIFEAPMFQRLRVLAYLARKGAALEDLAARDAYAFKRVPGTIERIASGRLPKVKRTAIEELGLELSLPDWMIARLVNSFGVERTKEIGRALDMRAPVTLRVNTAIVGRDEARKRIKDEHGIDAENTQRSPIGLILPGNADVQSWPLFEEGALEVMDEGSQLVALATQASAKETVFDACAGAGGKTLALAAMTENTGRVVALDPDAKKLEELKKRARRAKLTNVEAITGELEALPAKLKNTFDRVLVDAPCTGSGTFRRNPDARWRVTEKDLEDHVRRQRMFLASAIGAAKIGGTITYATCSILREENEGVAEELAKIDERIEPIAAKRIGPGPTERDPDGFYFATFRRRS